MNPCRHCGAPAIEQVRGLLGPDDKGYIAPGEGFVNSNNPANARDMRISCSNPDCDNQTGWNRIEYDDYMRFKWDRDHAQQSPRL